MMQMNRFACMALPRLWKAYTAMSAQVLPMDEPYNLLAETVIDIK